MHETYLRNIAYVHPNTHRHTHTQPVKATSYLKKMDLQRSQLRCPAFSNVFQILRCEMQMQPNVYSYLVKRKAKQMCFSACGWKFETRVGASLLKHIWKLFHDVLVLALSVCISVYGLCACRHVLREVINQCKHVSLSPAKKGSLFC